MEPWKPRKGLLKKRTINTTFEPMERELLGDAAADLCNALIERQRSAPKDVLEEMTGISSGHSEKPEDPGLARLLPDFETSEAEEFEGDNGMLRQLHEPDIISQKLTNLRYIVDALGPDGSVNVSLTYDDVPRWLAGLNDIRIYKAAAFIDDEGHLPEAGPDAGFDRSFVEWLAVCQESLLEVWRS